MNTKNIVALFITIVIFNTFAAGDITPVKRSMGSWPNALHNSTYHNEILPYRNSYSVPLNSAKIYGTTGAFNSDHTGFTFTTADGLVIGGKKTGDFVSVIWKLSAPEGNKILNLKAAVSGSLLSGNSIPDDAFTISIGTNLKLVGGGSFWAAFKDTGLTNAKSSTLKKGQDGLMHGEVSLDSPSGTVYLVLTRKIAPRNVKNLQLLVKNLTVNYELNPGKGIKISYDKIEPVWAEGSDIAFNLYPAGYKDMDRIWWRLLNTEGHVAETGAVPVSNGKANLDFSNISPGFYRLYVYDSFAGKTPVSIQDFAILAKQSPEFVSKSIFGVLGYPSIAGIHGNMGDPAEADIDLLKMMGVRWIKENALWGWSQKTEKSPIIIDKLANINNLVANGFEVIVSCGTSPKWANGTKTTSAAPLPEYYENWRNFNKQVAQATKGKVKWFQSWNEPNNPNTFWQKKWNTEKRANQAKTVQREQYKGLKEGNSEAKLIGGCFAGVPDKWYEMWLKEPNSTLNYQDAMSGHPYCKVTREENWAHKHPAEPNLVPRIMAARKVMNDNAAENQPMFFTEYGWFTPKTSIDDQAKWTARQNIITQAYTKKAKIEALCLFSPGDIKNGHNVLRFNQDILPYQHRLLKVIGAYAVSTSLLAGAEPLAAVSDYPEPVRCYSFKRNGDTLFAAWVTEDKESARIVLPVKEECQAIQIDLLGGKKLVSLKPGVPVNLPENHNPVYWVVKDKSVSDIYPKQLNFSLTADEVVKPKELQCLNIRTGAKVSTSAPWLKADLNGEKISVSIDKGKLKPGLSNGVISIATNNGTLKVPVFTTFFANGQAAPVKWNAGKIAAEVNSIAAEYTKGKQTNKLKSLNFATLSKSSVKEQPAKAKIRPADKNKNLARGKKVKYTFIDANGKELDGAQFRDPQMVNLFDGKYNDKGIAKSAWGKNKAKQMRIRFDFGQEVTPESLNVMWLLWRNKGHKISRVKAFSGNDVTNLKEVGVTDVEWAPQRQIPIQFNLTNAKGRYLDVLLEQDASPTGTMFTISEIEIFGSAKDN